MEALSQGSNRSQLTRSEENSDDPEVTSAEIDRMQTVFNTSASQATKVQFVTSQSTTSSYKKSAKSLTYSEPIQFAVTKTVTGFTERKVKSEWHPNKKRRISKYPRREDDMILTCRKPVSAFVPIDAWAQIFRRSDLKFLLQAQLVCKDFRDILSAQSMWRDARLYNYGAAIPGCPTGLNEKQYANLLVGRGCQVKPCTQKLTKKVYWAFMLRMCESCFKDSTQRQDDDCEEAAIYGELLSQLEHEIKGTLPARLCELLPASNVLGIGGVYTQTRPLDRDNQMWRYPDDARHYCTRIVDYEALKHNFRQNVMNEPSQFLRWAKHTWSETRSRVLMARELDIGCRDLLDRSRNLREEKQDFFLDQAEMLVPPMTRPVLEKMAAYHRALDTPNAASQRAWDTLAAKINKPELRAQASTLVQWDQESSLYTEEEGVDDRLAVHRGQIRIIKPDFSNNAGKSSEQKVVLELAEEILEELWDTVHDEDLLLMLLRNVRQGYEDMNPKPEGINNDGERGEYRLMLDDARMVVEEVLKPSVTNKGIVRSKRVLSGLRCIACTRTDCHKTYNFTSLFMHIRQAHACYVDNNLHYWKLAVPKKSCVRHYENLVAWYQLPWPKSMPALPYHQRAVAGAVWDPDVEDGYVQHESEEAVHFFEQLQAVRDPRSEKYEMSDDLVEAVKILLPTRLGPDCIVRVALEYASRRQADLVQENAVGLKLSISQLENWELSLKAVTLKFQLKFKCGLCLKDPKSGSRGKQKRETLYSQPLQSLIPHWHRKHRLEDDIWEPELIVLPSDLVLQNTVTTEDMKLTAEHNRILSKQQVSQREKGTGDIQEKVTPRESALLEIPTIKSRLRILFVPKVSHSIS